MFIGINLGLSTSAHRRNLHCATTTLTTIMVDDEYEEEQEMEMEALQSMFLDGEYEQIGDKHFQLTLIPIQGGSYEDNHVSVKVKVEYTPTYPDEKANITVNIVKGLKDSQRKEIQELVDACQEENIGMPCVYSITDVIIEYLNNNNRPAGDGSIHSEMLERQRLKAEAKEEEDRILKLEKAKAEKLQRESEEGQRQRYGTPLTRENFEEFNKKFIAGWDVKIKKLEIQRLAELTSRTKSSKSKSYEQVKLTGKQLFEVDTKMITSDAQLLAEIAFEQQQNERDEIFGSKALLKKQQDDNVKGDETCNIDTINYDEKEDLKNVDFSLFQPETEIGVS